MESSCIVLRKMFRCSLETSDTGHRQKMNSLYFATIMLRLKAELNCVRWLSLTLLNTIAVDTILEESEILPSNIHKMCCGG